METSRPLPDPPTRALLRAVVEADLPPMHTLTPTEARQGMLDGRINDIAISLFELIEAYLRAG